MRQQQTLVGRQILWIISAMILCIVVPLLLHNSTGGLGNTRNPWWSLGMIFVSGAAYASIISSASRQLFGMVLWLFTYLFMGLAPYVQYRLVAMPGTTPRVDAQLFPVAGSLALVCCVAVILGSVLARNSRRPSHALTEVSVDRHRANILSLAAITLFMYYASKVGFASFLLSRTEFTALRSTAWPNSATSTMLTGALTMGLLVAFLAQMALRQQDKARGLRPQVLPALMLAALLLFVVNPVNSARFTFGTVALAILAALGAYATLTRFRVMAALALAGMLLIFPLADTFRRSTEASIQIENPITALTSGDFDAFAQLTNTFDYVATNGLTYGGQLLGVLLLWVPRSVWPGKPEDTGVLLADHMGYQFTNLSAPIWAELLINFGWVGAVLGMGALGYLFRRWDQRTELYLLRFPMPPVMVSAVAFYLLIFLRGSLLAVSAYLLVILLASRYVTQKPYAPRDIHHRAAVPDNEPSRI